MAHYLGGGWYTQIGRCRLRDEVVDGAIDTAAFLYRAGVAATRVDALAAHLHDLTSNLGDHGCAAPHQATGAMSEAFPEAAAGDDADTPLSTADHDTLRDRLLHHTDRAPALQGFMTDCVEHVASRRDLQAMSLHLAHIAQMIRLLQVAHTPMFTHPPGAPSAADVVAKKPQA